MTKNKNIVSINIMRLICAYMVVAIHVHPFEEYNLFLSYLFTQIIPRVAVPFFFLTSGYFYTKSLISGKEIFRKYFNRLIFSYSVWSIIYIIFKLLTSSNQISIKSLLLKYFFFGTEYHLWYFPALIFCVIISTVFYKIKKLDWLLSVSIICYIIGVLGCSYYEIGIEIPFLNQLYLFSQFTLIRRVVMMGLPFFMLGYYINKIQEKIMRVKNLNFIYIYILITILFILEIFTVIILNIQDNIIITIFLYPLTAIIFCICLKNPLENLFYLDNNFKVIANFTYYSHPIFMSVMAVIFSRIFNYRLSPTPQFFLVIIFTTISALILKKINIKWINKIIS